MIGELGTTIIGFIWFVGWTWIAVEELMMWNANKFDEARLGNAWKWKRRRSILSKFLVLLFIGSIPIMLLALAAVS